MEPIEEIRLALHLDRDWRIVVDVARVVKEDEAGNGNGDEDEGEAPPAKAPKGKQR